MTTTSLRSADSRSAASSTPAPVTIPKRPDRKPLVVIPDKSRGMGLSVWATRGAGKSRLLGRIIAFQDFSRGVPLVILDPIGGTIDNFLDKVSRRPLAERVKLWQRVRYVNMNGQDGRIIPWPIYYQAYKGERFSDVSQRYIDVVARTDPDLARAAIQGMNAFVPVAHAAGIVLAALGLGITEARSLIEEPTRWEQRLAAVAGTYPETAPAVAQCRALAKLSAAEQTNRLTAFKSKLSLFELSPNFRAMFGATKPGINWHDVIDSRQAVLIDFRDVKGPDKKFCLLWVYSSLVNYIKHRGHGRHTPLSFIIDELSYLVGASGPNLDLLTTDIDELINRIARSHRVWLTIAGQELFQLPEQIKQTVLAMGNVLFGQTSHPATAEELAKRYYPYDPRRIKKTESIQGVVFPGLSGGRFGRSIPPRYGTVGVRTTEYTVAEQITLDSRVFLELQPFHFLLGQSSREGELPITLQPLTIQRLDHGQHADTTKTSLLRSELMRRDGTSEAALLAAIANRLTEQMTVVSKTPVTSGPPAQSPQTQVRKDNKEVPPAVRPRISRRSPAQTPRA